MVKIMAKISKTWWGEKFLGALTQFIDPGRLSRGKAYSKPGRLLKYELLGGTVIAKVRGNARIYFGPYKKSKYQVFLQLKTFTSEQWAKVLSNIVQNAGWVAKLMLDEMPEDIEEAFMSVGINLLPEYEDELLMECTCPDWEPLCKHIAGVYFKTATIIDSDPLLLFGLRGLSYEDLHKNLSETDIGKGLLANIMTDDCVIERQAALYTKNELVKIDNTLDLNKFWLGTSDEENIVHDDHYISASILKKSVDYPPFWPKQKSFIETMGEFYDTVKKKNKTILQ